MTPRGVRALLKRRVLRHLPHRATLGVKAVEVLVRSFLLGAHYEAEVAIFVDLVRAKGPGVVIDVGANLGQYSYPVSRLPNCKRVIAIEPQPVVAGLLRVGSWCVGAGKIQHVRALAGSAPGEAAMHVPLSGGKKVPQEAYMVPASPELSRLPVTTIDRVAKSAEDDGPVLAIKLDIEGAETMALLGAQSVLARFRPIVMAELNDEFMARFGGQRRALFDWMRLRGYRVLALAAGASSLAEVGSSLPPSNNYFFISITP